MKNTFTLILFITLFLNSFSQCKLKVDEYDKFERKTIKETKYEPISSNSKYEINLAVRTETKDANTNHFLKAKFLIITSKKGESPFSIRKDMSWYFILSNEDVIELKVSNELIKSTGVSVILGAIYELPDILFNLTPEMVDKFNNFPIKSIRVQYINNSDSHDPNKVEKTDCEIKEEKQFKIRDILYCLQ